MPRQLSRDPGELARWLRERRNLLGWTQERLSQEIQQRTDSSLSTSSIKKIEQGLIPITSKTRRLFAAIPDLGLDSYPNGRRDEDRLQFRTLWMPDYDIDISHARVADGLKRGVIRDNYDPAYFSTKGYQGYVDIQRAGFQLQAIESRNRMLNSIRDNLFSEGLTARPIDIISLSIGFGSPEIDLAIYLADHANWSVNLFIISNSIHILNSFKQMITKLNHRDFKLYMVLGYHESLDMYRETCLFSSGNRRIILLPSALAHHQSDIRLFQAISLFACAGDLLLIDVGEALAAQSDQQAIHQRDPRLNGAIDNSLENRFMNSLAVSVLEHFPAAQIASFGTVMDLPRPAVSSAEYFVSHYLTLESEHDKERRIIDIRFVRHSKDRLIRQLESYRWRLIRSCDWGEDIIPRFPGKIMLFCRY